MTPEPLKVTPGEAKQLERNLRGGKPTKVKRVYPLEIADGAILIVVEQYDAAGEMIAKSNINVPEGAKTT